MPTVNRRKSLADVLAVNTERRASLHKLLYRRRSSYVDPQTVEDLRAQSAVTHEQCVIKFFQFAGFTIDEIRKQIKNGWGKIQGLNYVQIGHDKDLCYGIFYLKPGQVWPCHKHPEEETYLFLSGSCTLRNGIDVSKKKRGDFVRILANEWHYLECDKDEEVVLGYVFPALETNGYGNMSYTWMENQDIEKLIAKNKVTYRNKFKKFYTKFLMVKKLLANC